MLTSLFFVIHGLTVNCNATYFRYEHGSTATLVINKRYMFRHIEYKWWFLFTHFRIMFGLFKTEIKGIGLFNLIRP